MENAMGTILRSSRGLWRGFKGFGEDSEGGKGYKCG